MRGSSWKLYENERSRKGFEVFQEEEAQTVNVNKMLQHGGGRIRQARELEVPQENGRKRKTDLTGELTKVISPVPITLAFSFFSFPADPKDWDIETNSHKGIKSYPDTYS